MASCEPVIAEIAVLLFNFEQRCIIMNFSCFMIVVCLYEGLTALYHSIKAVEVVIPFDIEG